MTKLKRLETREVSKLLKETIIEYTNKSWTLNTDFWEKLGEEVATHVGECFSEKFEVLSGYDIDFGGCLNYKDFMTKAEGYYKNPRTFTFTPRQEEHYDHNNTIPPYELLNDLLDLAERSESDFYGSAFCTNPVIDIVKKYCESWTD